MQLAETLLENGFTVDVISLKDGEQKIQYDKLGIACWVIENLTQNEEELAKLLGVYDAIIVNTLAGALICQFFSGKDENVYWWIRENELLFGQIKGYLKQIKLKKNIRVLAAGYYVQEQIKKYMDNGTNGFIFPVGDIETLKDIMKYIVINYKKLRDVKQEGRKIYEKYFSPKCFQKKVQQLIIGEL